MSGWSSKFASFVRKVDAWWDAKSGDRHKNGNFITVITSNISPEDLPISIRYYEIIEYKKANMKHILAYLKQK